MSKEEDYNMLDYYFTNKYLDDWPEDLIERLGDIHPELILVIDTARSSEVILGHVVKGILNDRYD